MNWSYKKGNSHLKKKKKEKHKLKEKENGQEKIP